MKIKKTGNFLSFQILLNKNIKPNLKIKKTGNLKIKKTGNLKIKKKKAVSPIVATVLLISIVIILGTIVFLWMRGITKEAITKFGNENIELACEKVSFEASYSYSRLDISNLGTVPISKFKIKVFDDQGYTTEEMPDSLVAGNVLTYEGPSLPFSTDSEKIIIIPVLRGNSNKGQMDYVCDDKFGEEIIL